MQLEINKLTANARAVLEEYLMLLNPQTPPETMLLNILSLASQMLCYNRVKINEPALGIETFLNLYTMIFMPSGVGKDLPVRQLKEACGFFDKDTKDKVEKYIERKAKQLEDYAETKFSSKVSKEKYIRDNMPRMILPSFGTGTPEGLVCLREQLQDMGFGSLHFYNGEFIDYITAKDQNRLWLLDILGEMFDHGDSTAKIIKNNDKLAVNVRGVPQTLSVHSSLFGLVDDKQANDYLDSFLGRKLARRSFLSYPDLVKTQLAETFEDWQARTEMANLHLGLVEEIYKKMYENTQFKSYMGGDCVDNKEVVLSIEAKEAYFAYNQLCNNKASSIKSEAVASELRGRSWKMIKLAGIIACFEHSEVLEVSKEDIELAIYLTEYFGSSFLKFQEKEYETLSDKVFDCLKSSGVCTIRDIQRKYFAKGKGKEIKYVLDYEVGEIAEHEGFIFKKDGAKYIVEPKPSHRKLVNDPVVCFSQSGSNERSDVIFNPVECLLSELPERLSEEKGYSAGRFKDNHRKQANWLGGDNILVFDVDNDNGGELTIKECLEAFKEYKGFIITTKSHLLEGKKSRYRVVIACESIPHDIDVFRNIKGNIINFLKLSKFIDIPASKDCARFYFGNKGEVFWLEGDKCLNWKVFDYTPIREEVSVKRTEIARNGSNLLPQTTVFSTRDGKLGIDQVKKRLSVGVSLPCRCIMPNHEDKNPSAFLTINQEGNLQFHCSGCGVTLFDK